MNNWWYHSREAQRRPLPGGPYVPRVYTDPTAWSDEDPEAPPGLATVNWSDIHGVPDEFPPEDHTHTWDHVTDPDVAADDVFARRALLWNALTDTDGAPIVDTDGSGLYDSTGPVDNPLVPTVTFQTVADLLAYPGDAWDTAQTLNWDDTDGNQQQWVMVADPGVAPNGVDRLEVDDGWGVARLVSARGEATGAQFASRDDVASAVEGARFIHHQTTPSASWEVVHPLGGRPAVTATDDDGKKVFAGVRYLPGDTIIVVTYATPRTGYIFLS